MKSTPFLVGLLLAASSFAYGNHRYLHKNTATFTVGNTKSSFTNPLADKKLFGNWVQEEWLFAIALPAAFLAGGAALALKK
ncbi:MAG: hypothetical protein PCFJNLEI_01887 [Verrucomicrobiae bacterium]|nr:hypothetical protein [Verrucomicrobiae bacterium]